jgi:hypothetical protein
VTLANTDTNLELILDISGSMAGTSLSIMKSAVNLMLNDYAALGNIKVHIVAFSTTASDVSGGWVDVATAKSIVNGLVAGGNTNYTAATNAGMAAWTTSGKIVGANNMAYFLSDGVPNPTSSALSGTAWPDFLVANQITALGFGMGTGATAQYLDPVAYNGKTVTDTTATMVPTIADLPPILRDSVVSATAGELAASGSISSGVGFGGDGGYLKSITLDGATYTFAPATHTIVQTGTARTYSFAADTLSINTIAGGKYVVNMSTGTYTYTPTPTTKIAYIDKFDFVMSDKDGDIAANTLTITVNPPATPPAPTYEIGISSVSAPSATEGGNLVYTVNLSGTTTAATTFSTLLGRGTATSGTDYNATPTFTNGVTINSATGVISVPAGVSSFTASINTLADTATEGAETVPWVIGGVTGTGNILDGAAPPTITAVSAPSAVEGAGLVYTVTLGSATTGITTYAYTLGGGTTSASATDYVANATFSNGVTLSGGTLAVPSGVTSFTVTVPTVVDTSVEVTETLRLRVGGVSGYGNIIDPPAIRAVESGATGTADDNVVEGYGLVYTVTLASATTAASQYSYVLGGGTATAGTDYGATATFSNGVTYDSSTGLITVPIGVSSFTVNVSTIDDTTVEAASRETLPLVIGGVTGTGGILDNEVASTAYPGTAAANTYTGTANANVMFGLGGNDNINGAAGDDYIKGGSGIDSLTGGLGSDTFAWKLGDAGTAGAPAADIVTDFTENASDKLDLRDLLQGENHVSGAGNLASYLHFEQVGANTLVHISSTGSLTAGGANAAAVQDQTIQLNGVTLATLGGSFGTTDAAIIQNLLTSGKLIVD